MEWVNETDRIRFERKGPGIGGGWQRSGMPIRFGLKQIRIYLLGSKDLCGLASDMPFTRA